MRKIRIGFMCVLATLLVAFVAGCGQETVTLPGVASVTPAQGSANVAVGTTITATFSQAMSASSINTSTFTVAAQGGTAVTGTVAYSGTVATFTPSAALAYGTTYTATITTGAATPGGAALIGPFAWSFTTVGASVPFVVPPPTPALFASNVPLTGAGATISVTFSQAMTAASIGAAGTFTVEAQGGVAVPGSAALNGAGTVATFTPTSGTLAYSTTYTVMITTAAKSLAQGIPLAGNYTWTFTTLAPGIPFVSSVSPVQGAANVAVNAPIIANFSIPMNPASINGTTTFTVYGPNNVPVPGSAVLTGGTVATFTPTGGALANNTTYTATITTAATSVGGYPIVANYVWSFTTITPTPLVISTVPLNTATGVPISQVLTARFNVSMLCSTLQHSPSINFTLTGPGLTTVTGAGVCSGSVATFTPGVSLLYNTVYTATISTGAQDVAGTPLAGPYVWTFTTVAAPPPAPAVIATVPVNLAIGVPVNQALSATFNEAMDPASINSATFTLVQTSVPGTPINGVITYVPAGSVATFTPNAPLLYNTNYTAKITAGAEDLNDDAFVTAYTWTFTTAAALAPIVPTVTSTIPVTPSTIAPIVAENVTVPLNQAISANFSVAMNPSTITAITPPTFTLTYMVAGVTTPVAGLVAYSGTGNQLVFLPSANLLANTTYTATITTAAQSLTGTPLASNYSWIFATAAAVSTTGPELVSTVPANNATLVPINQAVSATFNAAMNPLTLTNATFQLHAGTGLGGALVPATITYDPVNFIATLTPTNPLATTAFYTATVTTGATDLAGNALGSIVPSPYTNPWTFETGAAAVPPPVVLGPTILPFGGAAGSAGMVNVGTLTVVNGDAGTTAAVGNYSYLTGFHDNSVLIGGVPECSYTEVVNSDIGLVTGTIYSALVPTSTFCPLEGTAATTATAAEAWQEALTAYNTLQGLPGGLDVSVCPGCGGGGAGELGGRTLAPGIYKSAVGTFDIGANYGPLTLDAKGDPNAYWVFQMGTSLTVGDPVGPRPESVLLVNGAKARNVFWAVGSAATINYGGGGTFMGTVIASSGVVISSAGAVPSGVITTINGRVIGLYASVTMANTVINVPPAQ